MFRTGWHVLVTLIAAGGTGARLCLLVMALSLVGLPRPLVAQTPVGYGGCVDFRGVPVLTLANQGVNDVAVASLAANGAPIIQYNPQVLARFTAPMRRWWYMHECGHHARAHAVRNIPLSQEQESDCFAVVTLVRNGEFGDAEVMQVQRELSTLGSGDWQHLPGPQRAFNLGACLTAAGLNDPVPPRLAPSSGSPPLDPEPERKTAREPKSPLDLMDERTAREAMESELREYGDSASLTGRPEAATVMHAVRTMRGDLFTTGDPHELRRDYTSLKVLYRGGSYDVLTGARPGEVVLTFTIPNTPGRWRRVNTEAGTWGVVVPGSLYLSEGSAPSSRDRCIDSGPIEVAVWITPQDGAATQVLIRSDPIRERLRYSYADRECTRATVLSPRPLSFSLDVPARPE